MASKKNSAVSKNVKNPLFSAGIANFPAEEFTQGVLLVPPPKESQQLLTKGLGGEVDTFLGQDVPVPGLCPVTSNENLDGDQKLLPPPPSTLTSNFRVLPIRPTVSRSVEPLPPQIQSRTESEPGFKQIPLDDSVPLYNPIAVLKSSRRDDSELNRVAPPLGADVPLFDPSRVGPVLPPHATKRQVPVRDVTQGPTPAALEPVYSLLSKHISTCSPSLVTDSGPPNSVVQSTSRKSSGSSSIHELNAFNSHEHKPPLPLSASSPSLYSKSSHVLSQNPQPTGSVSFCPPYSSPDNVNPYSTSNNQIDTGFQPVSSVPLFSVATSIANTVPLYPVQPQASHSSTAQVPITTYTSPLVNPSPVRFFPPPPSVGPVPGGLPSFIPSAPPEASSTSSCFNSDPPVLGIPSSTSQSTPIQNGVESTEKPAGLSSISSSLEYSIPSFLNPLNFFKRGSSPSTKSGQPQNSQLVSDISNGLPLPSQQSSDSVLPSKSSPSLVASSSSPALFPPTFSDVPSSSSNPLPPPPLTGFQTSSTPLSSLPKIHHQGLSVNPYSIQSQKKRSAPIFKPEHYFTPIPVGEVAQEDSLQTSAGFDPDPQQIPNRPVEEDNLKTSVSFDQQDNYRPTETLNQSSLFSQSWNETSQGVPVISSQPQDKGEALNSSHQAPCPPTLPQSVNREASPLRTTVIEHPVPLFSNDNFGVEKASLQYSPSSNKTQISSSCNSQIRPTSSIFESSPSSEHILEPLSGNLVQPPLGPPLIQNPLVPSLNLNSIGLPPNLNPLAPPPSQIPLASSLNLNPATPNLNPIAPPPSQNPFCPPPNLNPVAPPSNLNHFETPPSQNPLEPPVTKHPFGPLPTLNPVAGSPSINPLGPLPNLNPHEPSPSLNPIGVPPNQNPLDSLLNQKPFGPPSNQNPLGPPPPATSHPFSYRLTSLKRPQYALVPDLGISSIPRPPDMSNNSPQDSLNHTNQGIFQSPQPPVQPSLPVQSGMTDTFQGSSDQTPQPYSSSASSDQNTPFLSPPLHSNVHSLEALQPESPSDANFAAPSIQPLQFLPPADFSLKEPSIYPSSEGQTTFNQTPSQLTLNTQPSSFQHSGTDSLSGLIEQETPIPLRTDLSAAPFSIQTLPSSFVPPTQQITTKSSPVLPPEQPSSSQEPHVFTSLSDSPAEELSEQHLFSPLPNPSSPLQRESSKSPRFSASHTPPINQPFTSMAVSQTYRPVYHHWFYKRGDDKKNQWYPFSMADSLNLEQQYTSDVKVEGNKVVATDGGRYDVDVESRKRTAVYWHESEGSVRRCSWFVKGAVDFKYQPYDENIAALLEEEYKTACMKNEWNRRVELADEEVITILSPNSIVHHQRFSSPDPWETPPPMDKPRVVKRGLDEFDIPEGEPTQVDHLLLLVHGIGEVCDLRFRSLVEVVDDFRSISVNLVGSHFKMAAERGKVGRVEVLPVEWHRALHTEAIDQRLNNITLPSIPRARKFTNESLLDILFYTSPVFCERIVEAVGAELNRVYSLYLKRNPGYKGGVSLGGHSLGSLILFDMLCHQKPHPKLSSAPSFSIDEGDEDISSLGCLKTRARLSRRMSYLTIGTAGTGQPYIAYPQLSFQPRAFFALGSPIGMFVTVRGVESLGEEFKFPTCPSFFNIFHPNDPVAYRIEGLIHPDMANHPAVLIPHHKGRKRMHLELKETMAHLTSAVKQKLLDSVKNTWSAMTSSFTRSTHLLDQTVLGNQVDKVIEDEMLHKDRNDDSASSVGDSTSSVGECVEAEGAELKVGLLNAGRRIDYVLQEAPLETFNQYISAVRSHLVYWESEDTMLLILKEIYGTKGITADCQVPQPILPFDLTPEANADPGTAYSHYTVSPSPSPSRQTTITEEPL